MWFQNVPSFNIYSYFTSAAYRELCANLYCCCSSSNATFYFILYCSLQMSQSASFARAVSSVEESIISSSAYNLPTFSSAVSLQSSVQTIRVHGFIKKIFAETLLILIAKNFFIDNKSKWTWWWAISVQWMNQNNAAKYLSGTLWTSSQSMMILTLLQNYS